jgi:hypothetical protein
MAEKTDDPKIGSYDQGEGDAKDINGEIGKIWKDLVAEHGPEVAKILGVGEKELDPKTPPFRANSKGSGTGVAELLILLAVAAAKGAGIGAGGYLAKEGLAKAKKLWAKHFEPKMTSSKKPLLGKKRKE